MTVQSGQVLNIYPSTIPMFYDWARSIYHRADRIEPMVAGEDWKRSMPRARCGFIAKSTRGRRLVPLTVELGVRHRQYLLISL